VFALAVISDNPFNRYYLVLLEGFLLCLVCLDVWVSKFGFYMFAFLVFVLHLTGACDADCCLTNSQSF
jgi:hypothetical protein